MRRRGVLAAACVATRVCATLTRALRAARRSGEADFERQLRYHTAAGLPFAYRTEEGGRYVYILPDALTVRTRTHTLAHERTTHACAARPAHARACAHARCAARPQSYARAGGGASGAGSAAPVPPCIQRLRAGNVQVAVSLEERAKACALLRVTADDVSVAVTRGAMSCSGELLDLMAKALGVRHQQMSLMKGWSDRSKMLLVAGISPEELYGRLQAWLDGERARGALKGQGAPPQPPAALMPPPPPRAPARGVAMGPAEAPEEAPAAAVEAAAAEAS
jgi:uncharacterized protein YggU (UPF0235/DUF167 family)